MALHYAVRNKLLVEIRSLVENGVNVNVRDKDRRTPLMLCCVEEDEKFAAGIARMLLQAGAKVGLVDKDGRNSLMFASMFGRTQLTKLFVKAVDFNLNLASHQEKDSFENTALHFAALKGNVDVTKIVLEAVLRVGAHVNSRNRIGQTAAAIALHQGNVSCVELFKKMSKAVFNTKVPGVLLMRPWSTDLKYIKNSSLMLKEAMEEIALGADIHKSRSDLNIHQFRRGGWAAEERTLNKRRKTSSRQSHRSASTPSHVSLRHRHNLFSGDCTRKVLLDSQQTSENPSWKLVVPELLDLLRVQVSESYRKSAVVVPQTIQDVFRPPEPVQVQPEVEEASEKPTVIVGGQENRRRSAQGLMKTKKSDLYDAMIDNKKKNRRCSLQPGDVAPQLQRRKTLSKIL